MKTRAPRNRTLTCTEAEIARYSADLLCLSGVASVASLTDRIVNQDFCLARPFLPDGFVDLLILDPPYNLTKNYNGHIFRSQEAEAYTSWFDGVATSLLPLLHSAASVYVCSDWRTSNLIFPVLDKYLHVRNRITWERERDAARRPTGRTTPKIYGSALSATTTISTLKQSNSSGGLLHRIALTTENTRIGRRRKTETIGSPIPQTCGLTSPSPFGQCQKIRTIPPRSRRS